MQREETCYQMEGLPTIVSSIRTKNYSAIDMNLNQKPTLLLSSEKQRIENEESESESHLHQIILGYFYNLLGSDFF